MGKTTIRDVAREAGVSISLVSLVMNAKRDAEGNLECNVNRETARRILEIAKQMGYCPNRAAASLRSGRLYTIGVITSDIANKFFSDISRYIENIAHRHNYTVLFGSSDENADKLDNILTTFISNGVEGVIIAPCFDSERVIRKALDAGIPTVLLDRNIENLDVGRVILDNVRAGRMGVEHLYKNGYRRIEMISYTLGITSLSEREEGYLEAMRRYGVDMDTAKRMTVKYRERYSKEGLLECSVYEGVPELVRKLRAAGRKCLIATGKPTKFTVDILEQHGLGDLFDDVLGSEFDGTRSQKWEVISELLKRCGPDGAVMVGDRDNDVNGAKTCGIPCIGVSWGYAEPGELLSAGAIYLVETVDALENILLG